MDHCVLQLVRAKQVRTTKKSTTNLNYFFATQTPTEGKKTIY